MDSTGDWVAEIVQTLGEQLRTAIDYLPNILGAIAVLMIGWLLARTLRGATQSASQASNRLLRRIFPTGLMAGARMSPFATSVVGEIVYWSVAFLALTVAARIAGLSAISEWLDRIAFYLPNLIAAFAILAIGFLIGIFVKEQLNSGSGPSDVEAPKVLAGRGAQAVVVTVALVMALDQLGIDVTLLIALLGISLAAIATTFGVSIALGARSYMSNLVGMRSVRSQLSTGLDIQVNGIAGHVIEITPSLIVLETRDGKALVPGQQASESVVVILAAMEGHGEDDE